LGTSIAVHTWRLHIPPHTALAARSAYDLDNAYLLVGDQLACWLEGLDARPLSDTFLHALRPDDLALALVTVFQYVEHLPDHAAADAVRTRLDWKYALHLPLGHPGIEYAALGSFRHRLLDHEAERIAFQCLLDWLTMIGFLGSEHATQDSWHVLQAVDVLSRAHQATEAMSRALEAIATRYSDWLRQVALPHWYQRYGHAPPGDAQENPSGDSACLLAVVWDDMAYLLESAGNLGPSALGALPEMQALHAIRHRGAGISGDNQDDVGGRAAGHQKGGSGGM
jgi:hypothetical protein